MYLKQYIASIIFSYLLFNCFLLSNCTKIPTGVIELNDRFLDVMNKGFWFVEVYSLFLNRNVLNREIGHGVLGAVG